MSDLKVCRGLQDRRHSGMARIKREDTHLDNIPTCMRSAARYVLQCLIVLYLSETPKHGDDYHYYFLAYSCITYQAR